MPRPLLSFCRFISALLLAAGVFLNPVGVHAQTFHADFSRWAGPPLVKDKFGVYQTPFFFKSHPPSSFDMTGLLAEAGVHDLRYEMGWGKPDTYAFDQIGGTPAALRIDWTRLDPFVGQLRRAGVSPLFAMTYNPLPLKTGTEWSRWKDVPGSLPAWREINRRYAAHYRALGLQTPRYEMWNEPDLPGDGGKVFFNGGPDDYARVAQAGLEHMLNLMDNIGFAVYLLSHWLKANVTLKGTSDTWHMALLLLGAVLMVSGSPLKEMWHHKQMFLFHIFGGAVLVAALFCLALLVLDASGFWYKVCRK